jgi:hypothetical protein
MMASKSTHFTLIDEISTAKVPAGQAIPGPLFVASGFGYSGDAKEHRSSRIIPFISITSRVPEERCLPAQAFNLAPGRIGIIPFFYIKSAREVNRKIARPAFFRMETESS